MRPLYREFTTQAEIDAQYNASMSVADATAELRHYVERARTAVDTLPSVLDVPFGPTRAETLDIFPAASSPAPVFIYLHGGYWRALSSREFSGIALGLHPLGITTVVVNYALCPRVSLDEVTRQARASVAWVLRRIGDHGGDPTRVAVGGHSAGAHLAAMCLETAWADDYGLPVDPLAGAVLVSGVYDIEPLRYSYLQPAIQLDDGLIRRNSPMFHVRPCATPVRVTWGSDETSEFVRQAADFHAAWQAGGNASELAPQPDANHFTAIHGFEDPASDVCQWLAHVVCSGSSSR
ncbi:MAG: alpha/beta hydrolase [Acidobacteriota bacterium]|nr:alpha/beta hydrolase [Acidobacteriota bacterium]